MFTGSPSDNKLSWIGVFVHLILPHLPKGGKRNNTKSIINNRQSPPSKAAVK